MQQEPATCTWSDNVSESVFVAVPTYDNKPHMKSVIGAYNASATRQCKVALYGSSLLANGFNKLWLQAVKSGCDIWAMCHADVGPEPGWVDKLLDIADMHGAGICSAAIRIKTDDEWYSIAMAEPGCTAHYVLKQQDIDRLPVTFGTEDVQSLTGKGGCLCANTGLWVCRLSEPWVRQVSFCVRTWIDWDNETALCIPEDWDLSQQLHRLGVKVVCTTAVDVVHYGEGEWRSERNGEASHGTEGQAAMSSVSASG
jgi:GT2 family glycosyltransferase